MYILNQEVFNKPPKISVDTKAFLYGENLITTFLVYKSIILEDQFHINRIIQGAKVLFPSFFENSSLENRMKGNFLLLKSLSLKSLNTLRVRVNVYESGGKLQILCILKPYKSLFLSKKLRLIQANFLAFQNFQPAAFNDVKFSFYAREFLYREKTQKDFIKLDQKGFVSEMSTSHLVFQKGFKFYEPSADYIQGSGISLFKKFLKDKKGIMLEKVKIHSSKVFEFDSIFSINAVEALSAVNFIDGREVEYSQETFKEYYNYVMSQYKKLG